MKASNKKRLDISVLMILIFVVLGISYYSYSQYSKYNDYRQNKQQLLSLQSLHKLLGAIDAERELSALYIANHANKDIVSRLKKKQEHVDSIIETIKKSRNNLSKEFFFKIDKIKDLRNKVLKNSIDFNNLFIRNYTEYFSFAILDEINTVKQALEKEQEGRGFYNSLKAVNLDKLVKVKEVQSNKAILDLYIELIMLQENISIEKGFISFLLAKEKRFNESHLLTWNRLIGKDYIPQFTTITQNDLSKKLYIIFDKDIYFSAINNLRAKIILASANNRLKQIDKKEWNEVENEKISKILQSTKLLVVQLDTILDNNIGNIQKELSILALAFLFLLILFTMLYLRFKSSSKDETGFKEAIEDIRLTLDPTQQAELNCIIEKQDKVKIYNFMADTIAKSSRSKDLFLANMSHEIRTPLNGILGFTQLLKGTKLTQEQLEFIKIIDSSSNNLLVIVNDILDLAKIEENKVELEAIEFNPFEVFESAIESYGAKADEKNIHLQLFVDPHIDTTLQGDPTKLTQVVVNLISNAIKFTPENGVIDVRVEKISSINEQSTIKFSVKDTGIGVSEEQKENIFKAFSQEDVSTSREYGGTGLGLTISTRFIEAMGGKLDIDSIKGEGATFFFELTLPEVTLIEMDKSNHKIGFCMPYNQKHINERENIKKYIEYTGAEYTEYTSIETLINSDQLHELTLLFVHSLDSEEIKKIPESNLKIVHISKLDNFKGKDKQILSRIDSVIYKPINFSKIKRSIHIHTQPQSSNPIVESNQAFGFDNLSVLVAEDNIINQKLMEHTLSTMRITPTMVANGKEAVKQRKKNNYDIILMDIQMPVMDGVEATHKILHYEKKHKLPHVPIIALTANTLKGDRERLLKEGMDNFLPKPLELDLMKNMLKEYFPDKITSSESRIDIILCKNQKSDNKLFKALFESMGYSVDTANSFSDYTNKINNVVYDYSFADSFLFDENPTLKNILQSKNIKNVLFVNGLQNGKVCQYSQEFDNIIPGIADKSLLEYYMEKI